MYPGDEIARKAFDVQIRRGWFAAPLDDGSWCVHSLDESVLPEAMPSVAADPYTALAQADEWCKANRMEA